MKKQTLKKGWKHLFDSQDAYLDLESLEVSVLCRSIYYNAGEEVAEKKV